MDQFLKEWVSQLSSLYYVIMLVGIVLLAMIAAATAKAVRTASLNRYRTSALGLADLLNSAAEVDNGVIVGKNGSFLAAWAYQGSDASSLTGADRNLISERLNQVFASTDSGMMVHIDAMRTPIPKYPSPSECAFPDRVSAAIDQDRRLYFMKNGTSYDSTFVLTLTWLPPKLGQRRMRDLMFEDGTVKRSAEAQTKALIKEFNSKISFFENSLKVIFPNVTRLQTEEATDGQGNTVYYDYLLSWLYFALTGINQPIQRPETPVYLDTILGAQDYIAGTTPMIGRKHIKVIAIEGLAGATYPGMLSVLTELPCEYRISTRFIFMDRNEAASHMNSLRRKWTQKERGFFAQLMNNPNGRVNMDAVNMVSEADTILAQISEGSVAYGYLTQNVVIMDEDLDRLNHNVKIVLMNIQNLGLTARIEELNANDAYFGSLPGHGYENVRRPMVSTENLADIIPTSTPWIGQAQNPCDFYPENSPALMQCVTGASGSTAFRLNFHVRDVGHSLILGPTGAGKSTFLCLAVAQALRYRGMQIYSFDKGKSMYCLCKACGGQHYTPGADSKLQFCPLGSIESESDLSWASDWIEVILKLNGIQPSPEMKNEVSETLKRMYAGRKALEAKGEKADMSISAFWAAVQDQEVRNVIFQYTKDGAQGQLIDGNEDSLSMSSFNVFEIEPLMNLGDAYSLPVLLYLFHRIEKSLRGQPTFIFLDEAWLMLGNPAFAAKIKEWLKVMRKNNCAVVMATQSLSDLASSSIFDALVESTVTRIYLPNPSANQEEPSALYRRMGLNMTQIAQIAGGIPKMDYFVQSGNNSRMVQLHLDRFQLAFVGVSDKEDLARIDELEAQYGEGKWVDAWVSERGAQWPEGVRY